MLNILGFVVVGALSRAHDRQAPNASMSVEVQRDVEVRRSDGGPEKRGTLYSSKTVVVRKGERLEMVQRLGEGGCRVLFKGQLYDLTSCPWLPGFQDHQGDIFKLQPAKASAPPRAPRRS